MLISKLGLSWAGGSVCVCVCVWGGGGMNQTWWHSNSRCVSLCVWSFVPVCVWVRVCVCMSLLCSSPREQKSA